MGEDGVVDDLGQVHGYPGLFVVDGSIVPTPLARNPTATICALAERAAFHMIHGRELRLPTPPRRRTARPRTSSRPPRRSWSPQEEADMSHGENDKVGLVLAGGGARGAYEAGALSVLLPVLEERGQPVRVIVGTSVGAISAAMLGAHAHRGVAALVDAALVRWRGIERDDIIGSLAGRLPRTALEYLGQTLRVRGVRVQSLLDTAPLRASLDDWINWDQLHANVVNGAVE
jgi:predicted acylesterase/phospholipase RssA